MSCDCLPAFAERKIGSCSCFRRHMLQDELFNKPSDFCVVLLPPSKYRVGVIISVPSFLFASLPNGNGPLLPSFSSLHPKVLQNTNILRLLLLQLLQKRLVWRGAKRGNVKRSVRSGRDEFSVWCYLFYSVNRLSVKKSQFDCECKANHSSKSNLCTLI